MRPYEELLSKVRQVRIRRRRLALVKGVAILLAFVAAILLVGVWIAHSSGFRPAAVWIVRLCTGGAVLAVAWYFLLAPLRRRVSDVQIAQFIEERYPQLEDRLVTAIEYGGRKSDSAGMIELLIKDAVDSSRRVDLSVFLNRNSLISFGVLGGAACLALVALFTVGPSFFPYGFQQLYAPWTEASGGQALSIAVSPGDIEITKGSDQEIQAQLRGFDSPDVRLYLRAETAEKWKDLAMDPEARGSRFRYLLLDIPASLKYYVESEGIRSPTHSILVRHRAQADRITLTYRFPAYTGMRAQVVENEGDISAIKGTGIEFRIRFSKPVQSARLHFDDQSDLVLSPAGAQEFTGTIRLQRSGSYVIQAAEKAGGHYAASPEYTIESIEDAVPQITITRPMRDVRATNVEEVFAEIKAEDDIGINRLELRYSVNGAPEKSVALHKGNTPEPSVIGAHTFFLEDFGLQPGDVISYYGRAFDTNNVTGPGTADSEIYFIQIRPFEQKYVQNQAGAPGGGDQANEGQEALSRQQKDIVSATFKLIREKARMPQKEYVDGLEALALVQSRLQAQAQGVVDRLKRRGAADLNEDFQKLSEYLGNAIGEMGKAAIDLGARKPDSALPPEQKALQQLLRAESLFREIQVSFGMQSGSGGGSQADAEDLADLFELELNKLKNQYETVQSGEQQARDQQVDEALQRLKELAQRQQQLNARNRMLAQQGQNPSASSRGGSNQGQQQLMEQAEQLRRQLQRLSRERSSPQLNEAGSRLQAAIDEMKRALKEEQNGKDSARLAQGTRAQRQLDEAARTLSRGQQTGVRQGLAQAVQESKDLVAEQNRIQSELEKQMPGGVSENASGENGRDPDRIVSRKQALADRLRSLESRIQDLSRQTRKEQTATSRKLSEAAASIQDKRLRERILAGIAMLEEGAYEYQKQREAYIRSGLEDVSEQLESAQSSLGESTEAATEEAADRARQLAEGLESMQQRMSALPRGSRPERENGRPGPQELREPSANSSAPPAGLGRYGNEEARQLGRELEQRLSDALDLQRMLNSNPIYRNNLETVIQSLRRAGSSGDFNDPEQIARLRMAIDSMRKIELDLARNLRQLVPEDQNFSAEDNEVPGSFRKLVEEYFRAIAK